MGDDRLELPQGTLDLLMLKALSLGPQHGWAISERLHQVSGRALQIPQGSLYPALHRLERRGWISAIWDTSDNNRRAKAGSPGFFATIGTGIVRGRGFTAEDRAIGPPVTVVSRSMAAALWPGQERPWVNA